MSIIEDLFLPIIFALAIGLFLVHYDKEITKEKTIIEKTQEFTIFNHCKRFDEEWYCYD